MKSRLALFILLLPYSGFPQSDLKEAKIKTDYNQQDIQAFKIESSEGCSGASSAVSLYAEGGTLHQVKQQDQDGLATCYANTASLMLKSMNPNLPTPSYLDIASYNPIDKSKTYAFDHGGTCEILNKIKTEKIKLCGETLIENQPKEIQDKILYKLYDVINKYNYTQDQMLGVLDFYSGHLNSNPYPEKRSCADEGKINFQKYIGSKIVQLSDEGTYLNPDEVESDEASLCAKLMKNRLLDLKLVSLQRADDYEYLEANLAALSTPNTKYLSEMQNKNFPSGKTYYSFLAELVDSQPTLRATYEHVTGDTVQARLFQEKLANITRELDPIILEDFIQQITGDDPALIACAEKGRKDWLTPNPGLFFNNVMSECGRDTQKWREQIWEVTQSCHDPEKELLDVFKTLTALDQNVDDIKKYIVSKDQGILREIINNNCSIQNTYLMPANTCGYYEMPFGLGLITNANDWSIYQLFLVDLDEFLKNISPSTNVNLKNYVDFWLKKYAEGNAEKELSPELETYRRFMADTFTRISGDQSSINKDEFINKAKQTTTEYFSQKANLGKTIVNSINRGIAVGISTCGSIFSDSTKKNYHGCNNHAVTATGVKCEGGRLKVEVANSWGIGCNDDQSTSHMFACQKDIDGITNGKAWVDYQYLIDQGMGLYSF